MKTHIKSEFQNRILSLLLDFSDKDKSKILGFCYSNIRKKINSSKKVVEEKEEIKNVDRKNRIKRK